MSKTTTPPIVASATDTFEMIDWSLLYPSPDNVRDDLGDLDDLATSIAANGLQQPLRVTSLDYIDGDDSSGYHIIAGHRRYAAIGMLLVAKQWTGDIPCMVASAELDDQSRVAAMLVENLQRADLNPIEEGKAFARLTKEFRFKTADVAAKIGRSADYVNTRLSLLKLPEAVQTSVNIGFMPLYIAVALTKITTPESILKLTKHGRLVPTEDQILRQIRSDKYEALQAAFLKELGPYEENIASKEDRFNSHYTTEVVRTITDPKELRGLVVKKGEVLFIEAKSWASEYYVEVRKKLTATELAKRAAEHDANRDAYEAKRDAEQRDRFDAEQATWSPEYTAWIAECAEVEAHNVAQEATYRDAVEHMRRQFFDTASAKDVARWAMLDIVNRVGYDSHAVLRLLGEGDITHANAEAQLYEYANLSAANLVRTVAVSLYNDAQDYIEDNPVVAACYAFLLAADIPMPVLVEAPPEPTTTTEGAFDDPIHDVA